MDCKITEGTANRYSKFGRVLAAIILFSSGICAQTADEEDDRKAVPSWSVSNETIRESGRLFFPIGIYYVAHRPPEQQRRLEDIPAIAAAGFNVIYSPVDADDNAFLNACADAGLRVIAEFNEDAGLLIKKFGKHPALFAWAAFDDVDAQKLPGVPLHTPQAVKERTAELRRRTPRLLTYISGGYPQRLGQYAGSADLIGLQVYPIPDEPLNTVADAYLGPLGHQMQEADQLILANVQLFGWHGKRRFPNGGEVRNMTYQAIVGGVKGVLYYTFLDEMTDQRKNPVLWEEVRSLIRELRGLKDVLTNHERCVFQSDDPNVFAGTWTRPNRQLVIAVNTGAAAVNAKLTGCPTATGLKPAGSAVQPIATGEGLELRLRPLESAIFSGRQKP